MSEIAVLIVEDDQGARFGMQDFLHTHGLRVAEAQSCEEARQAFAASRPDAAVIDYRLPDGTALDLLSEFRRHDPEVPLVVLTGNGSIDLAVQAMKAGAEQFLTKPVELQTLLLVLRRAVEQRRTRQRAAAGRSREQRTALDPFLGTSAVIRRLAVDAERVAGSDSPVLIHGETGSGKGILAEWIHRVGQRGDAAFVDLNCAGLSREFLETELFGHERGAFTGAVNAKTGLLDLAHRGTVFLDEIGDLSMEVQPKLLKVLEEKRFRRLGGTRDRLVDIRLVAASHRDLAHLVRTGGFRSDLYYRLNTLPLAVPPLRERVEDIPVLADRILHAIGADLGRTDLALDPSAVQALARYMWPGNIRELRNVLERAALLADTRCIEPGDLWFDAGAASVEGTDAADLTLDEVIRRHIRLVMRAHGGRVADAAAHLGMPRSTLYQKLKQYDIEIDRRR